jgi:hypothetical protein
LAAHRRDRPSLCSNRRYSYSQQPTARFNCRTTYAMQLTACSAAGTVWPAPGWVRRPCDARRSRTNCRLCRYRVEPHLT